MNYQATRQRLNQLLILLQQHSPVEAEALLAALPVSRGTLLRDLEKLQHLGYPIKYCRKRRVYILPDWVSNRSV